MAPANEPILGRAAYTRMKGPVVGLDVPVWRRRSPMRAPVFGLSTTPVAEIKSELRLQLERDLLALVYRSPR